MGIGSRPTRVRAVVNKLLQRHPKMVGNCLRFLHLQMRLEVATANTAAKTREITTSLFCGLFINSMRSLQLSYHHRLQHKTTYQQ
jgi:hypothetical protein